MKSTCSGVVRRVVLLGGFLLGFGLLSAGVASADDDAPGLLDGVTESVLAPLNTVLDPVVALVVQSVEPVLAPLQPVVEPLLTPVDNPSVPVEVTPPAPAPDQVVPLEPVVPAVGWTDPVAAPATPPAGQQQSTQDVAPMKSVPAEPSPDVPLALPGTTGTAASSGSASPAAADLPSRRGDRPRGSSSAVVRGDQILGSWCYYYGRSHPS
ncbi:hypothetical protein [Lentzea sp. NPDC051838]|uniref:hypothetical protein n=1 Tax=Lentzea sp. NPDC051838 TaxID=3154849 RepID=UPI00343147DB